MALCLTFYTAFLIQTPADGSGFSENISHVYTIPHSLNRRLNAFHRKLILPQLLNTFPLFYWTVLTTAIRRSLSSGKRIKSTPSNPIPSDRFNAAFPSMSVFSTWSLDFRFPDHNFIRFYSSLLCVLHIILITASLILSVKYLVRRCLRIVTLLGVGFYAVSSASCHFPSL